MFYVMPGCTRDVFCTWMSTTSMILRYLKNVLSSHAVFTNYFVRSETAEYRNICIYDIYTLDEPNDTAVTGATSAEKVQHNNLL